MLNILVNIDWVLACRSEFLSTIFHIFPFLVSDVFYFSLVALGYWFTGSLFYRDLGLLITLSTLLNYFLKSLFMVTRPTILHLVATDGTFGFPSGDVQVAYMVWMLLALRFQKKWLWGLSVGVIGGIGLSRLYFGVHTPLDLLGAILVGMVCVWGYNIYKHTHSYQKYCVHSSVLLGAVLMSLLVPYGIYMYPDLKPVWVLPAGALAGMGLSLIFIRNKSKSLVTPLKGSYRKTTLAMGIFIFTYMGLRLAIPWRCVLAVFIKAALMSFMIFYLIPLFFDLLRKEK